MNKSPLIAVTMGDAAGVGPEVMVRAWGDAQVQKQCRLVAIGHPEILRTAVKLVRSPLRVETVEDFSSLPADPDVMACLPVGTDDVLDVEPGKLDSRTGQAAWNRSARAGPRRCTATHRRSSSDSTLARSRRHAAGEARVRHVPRILR